MDWFMDTVFLHHWSAVSDITACVLWDHSTSWNSHMLFTYLLDLCWSLNAHVECIMIYAAAVLLTLDQGCTVVWTSPLNSVCALCIISAALELPDCDIYVLIFFLYWRYWSWMLLMCYITCWYFEHYWLSYCMLIYCL